MKEKSEIVSHLDSCIVFFITVVAIIAVLCFACFTLTIYKNGYRQGQIDVANGNMKYELVDHKNGTKTWQKIKVIEEKK